MRNVHESAARLSRGRNTILMPALGFLFVISCSLTALAGEDCDLTNLTAGIGSQASRNSYLPKLSSDGTRISFESSRDFFNQGADTTRQIFYIDTVAGMIFPVTSGNGGSNRLADISGDGTKVVFTSNKDLAPGNTNADLSQEMFLYDITTGVFTQLTFSSLPSFSSQTIPFSDSDGSVITFSSFINTGSNPDGNSETFLYDTPTAQISQVTLTTGNAINFVNGISADGTRVVFPSRGNFTGGNADGNVEIFMYDSTMNMFTQVTNIVGGSTSNFASGFPDISADGSTIVFQSVNDHVNENGDGNAEIFSYDVASNTITQITHTLGTSSNRPAVNADGTRIVFGSNGNLTGENPSGSNRVFLYDVPGDMFTQVSSGQSPDIDADGDRIVFERGFGPTEIVLAECGPGGDSDGDGVDDEDDECPDSITDEAIVIDGCDSGVPNIIGDDGCSISDLIDEIAAGAGNHGGFTSEVSHLLNELKALGIISGAEKGAVQDCAAGASIP